jgi:type II secretory pathway component PulK
MTRDESGGYVLLSVLWLTLGVVTVGVGVAQATRHVIRTSANRVAAIEAFWVAQSCVSELESWLESLRITEAGSVSAAIEGFRANHTGCRTSVHADGAALNVNRSDMATLRATLLPLTLDRAQADSIAAAILDWIDPDTIPRPMGAERSQYLAAGRLGPTNRAIDDPEELTLIRGIESVDAVHLLGVVEAPLSIDRATAALLGQVGGVPERVAEEIVRVRDRSGGIRSWSTLSELGNTDLADAVSRLVATATLEPRSWEIRFVATGSGGGTVTPAITESSVLWESRVRVAVTADGPRVVSEWGRIR